MSDSSIEPMNVGQLIAALQGFPPDALVRLEVDFDGIDGALGRVVEINGVLILQDVGTAEDSDEFAPRSRVVVAEAGTKTAKILPKPGNDPTAEDAK